MKVTLKTRELGALAFRNTELSQKEGENKYKRNIFKGLGSAKFKLYSSKAFLLHDTFGAFKSLF